MAEKRARSSDDASDDAGKAAASSSITDPDGLELLTSAMVVTRAIPQIASLPHVTASVSAFPDGCIHFRTLEDAAKTNDLRLLRRLLAAYKRPLPSTRRYPLFLRFHVFDAVKVAAKLGHNEALKLLHQVNPQSLSNDEVLAILAGRGDLAMINWLEENCSLDQDSDVDNAIEVAMNNHHAHVLERIEENRPSTYLPISTKEAVTNSQFDVAKWLSDWISVNPPPGIANYVVEYGNLEMFKWLDEHPEFYSHAFDRAVGSGRLDVIQ